MPSSDRITAFFSYARVDWEADEEELGQIFQQIEKQARAAGAREFDKWLDTERLLWGEDWHQRLYEVIVAADLFFVFLSPGWLASDICREELEAFLKRQESLGGKRVFVAQIRDIDEQDQAAHGHVLAGFRSSQVKQWSSLLTADPDERRRACHQVGKEIAARLKQLPGKVPTPHEAAPPNADVPLICGQKLASGDFYIPLRAQGGEVDGKVPAFLRLLFCGWAKATTEHGCFVFGAIFARLKVSVTGGRLLPHPEFAATSRDTIVKPIGGGRDHSLYHIITTNRPLWGNVLSRSDEHVPVALLERINGAPVKVNGTVEVEPDCVTIDTKRSTPNSTTSAEIETMRQRLAELILQEHGSSFALEEAES